MGSISVKNKGDDQSCSDNGRLQKDKNNNCPASNHEDRDTLDEQALKVSSKKERSDEQKRKPNMDKNDKKNQEKNKTNFLKSISKSKAEIQEDETDNNVVSKVKKQNSDTMLGSKTFEGSYKKNKSESGEKLKGTSEIERESKVKSKPSKETSLKNREPFSSNDKHSKTLKGAKEDKSLEMSKNSEVQPRKRKKNDQEKNDNLKYHPYPESKKYSKPKKAKMVNKDAGSDSEQDKPPMSFESYLNYDVTLHKKKEHSGVKKAPKTTKTASKKLTSKDPETKPLKSPASFLEQVYLMVILKVCT